MRRRCSRVGSPGAGPYVPVANVGVMPTRKEKGRGFIEDIKDSSSTVEVSAQTGQQLTTARKHNGRRVIQSKAPFPFS